MIFLIPYTLKADKVLIVNVENLLSHFVVICVSVSCFVPPLWRFDEDIGNSTFQCNCSGISCPICCCFHFDFSVTLNHSDDTMKTMEKCCLVPSFRWINNQSCTSNTERATARGRWQYFSVQLLWNILSDFLMFASLFRVTFITLTIRWRQWKDASWCPVSDESVIRDVSQILKEL